MFVTECPECGLPAAPLEHIKTGAWQDIILLVCVDMHKSQVVESDAIARANQYKLSQGT